MYCAVIMLKNENANYEEMNQVAMNGPDVFKGVKGFVNAVYYSDKEKGEYGGIYVFENKEDLDANWDAMPTETKDLVDRYGSRDIYYVNNAFSA